jgi:hypothetical protein
LAFTQNLANFIQTWAFNHLKIFFYFQYVGEINGVNIPFTIGIQTPMQLQFMILCGDNGAISMDATFGTNDVKFHLFTLMVFYAHCTSMLAAWIITSRQKIENLVEWLFQLWQNFITHVQLETLLFNC